MYVTDDSISRTENTYSEKYILGGIEACGVDARRVGWVTFANHPTSKAGDGALRDGRVLAIPAP